MGLGSLAHISRRPLQRAERVYESWMICPLASENLKKSVVICDFVQRERADEATLHRVLKGVELVS